jgi:hypothetical protein
MHIIFSMCTVDYAHGFVLTGSIQVAYCHALYVGNEYSGMYVYCTCIRLCSRYCDVVCENM